MDTQIKTVLIVEEDERLLVVLSLIMEEQGFKVIAASGITDLIFNIPKETQADYLLHNGPSEEILIHWFTHSGKILSVLTWESQSNGLPDLTHFRHAFLKAV